MLRSRIVLSGALRNVNGGSLLKSEEKFFPIIPPHNPSQRTSARFHDVYEDTKDEMSRGYFQDMRDLEKHGGKISKANKIIIPATQALKFPILEVNFTDGSKLKLPVNPKEDEANVSTSVMAKVSTSDDTNVSTSDTAKASLICSFRANSRPMVDSWTSSFLKTFANSSDVRLYEVSLIDSWLLSRKLIAKLLLKFMRKPEPAEKQDDLQRQIVYSFGDHYYFRKELKIVNLLTGYMFLLDKSGRIRWSGTGAATEEELSSLRSCASILLEEN